MAKTMLLIGALVSIAAVPARAAAQIDTAACVGKPGNAHVVVTVDRIRDNRGQLAITLYPDDSRRFLKNKGSLYVRFVPVTAPQTRFCILIPEPGVYAIAIYHDANANERIDKFGVGIPSEGFGFSNNPSTFFGLPRFASARIHLTNGMETRISLRYLRGNELKNTGR